MNCLQQLPLQYYPAKTILLIKCQCHTGAGALHVIMLMVRILSCIFFRQYSKVNELLNMLAGGRIEKTSVCERQKGGQKCAC